MARTIFGEGKNVKCEMVVSQLLTNMLGSYGPIVNGDHTLPNIDDWPMRMAKKHSIHMTGASALQEFTAKELEKEIGIEVRISYSFKR